MVKNPIKYDSEVIIGENIENTFKLPDASASPTTLYGPRGIFVKDNITVVADTGNHRVLIWFSIPKPQQPADIVLGQPDFFSDSVNAGGNIEKGMFMPTGIFITDDKKLFVADAWNHRILMWESLPDENFKKPDHIIGQPDLRSTEKNLFFWCFGVLEKNGKFFVCDTGNRRILEWKTIPDNLDKPDEIYTGFMWPHSISVSKNNYFVADAGTGVSKVYMFKENLKNAKNFDLSFADKEGCGKCKLNLPYGVSSNSDIVAVADTSNNRVLLFEDNIKEPIDVLGQHSFEECGENRWEGVKKDTLCWPYAVHVDSKNNIFIADTGNNRIILFKSIHGGKQNVSINTIKNS